MVYLRFALKAAALFADNHAGCGVEFIKSGTRRITKTLDFMGAKNMLVRQYGEERLGWNLCYNPLTAIEDALKREGRFAQGLRKKAQGIIEWCIIGSKQKPALLRVGVAEIVWTWFSSISEKKKGGYQWTCSPLSRRGGHVENSCLSQ